jgi:hypothetical protein
VPVILTGILTAAPRGRTCTAKFALAGPGLPVLPGLAAHLPGDETILAQARSHPETDDF